MPLSFDGLRPSLGCCGQPVIGRADNSPMAASDRGLARARDEGRSFGLGLALAGVGCWGWSDGPSGWREPWHGLLGERGRLRSPAGGAGEAVGGPIRAVATPLRRPARR